MTTAIFQIVVEGINRENTRILLEDIFVYAQQECGGTQLEIGKGNKGSIVLDTDKASRFYQGTDMLVACLDPDRSRIKVTISEPAYGGPCP